MALTVDMLMKQAIAQSRQRAQLAALRQRKSQAKRRAEGRRRELPATLANMQDVPQNTAYWQASAIVGVGYTPYDSGVTDWLDELSLGVTDDDDDDDDDDNARSAALTAEYVREQRADEAASVPALDLYAIAARVCGREQRRLREARLGAKSGPHQYPKLETMRDKSPAYARAFNVVTMVIPDLLRARMSVTLESPANDGARVSMPMAEVMNSRSELLSFLVYMCQLPAVRAGRIAAYVLDVFSAISRSVADFALMEVLKSDEQHAAALSAGDLVGMLRDILGNYPPCHDKAKLRIQFDDFTSA